MTALIDVVAASFPFADQPCSECGTSRPLSELVPLTAQTAKRELIGWKCREGCAT